VFPDGTTPVLTITSVASATTSSIFPAGTTQLATSDFVTSCQVYADPTLVIDDARVSVDPATNAGTVRVWAVAAATTAPTLSVAGTTLTMSLANTYAPANPIGPAGFTIWYAAVPLAARPSWVLDLTLTLGSASLVHTIRPVLTGSAVYDGTTLQVGAVALWHGCCSRLGKRALQ
jgi:hypothetical protein